MRATPMIRSSALSKDEGDRLVDSIEYRSLAGALQYVVLTRLDIAYAYLRGTIDYRLIFCPSVRLSLIGYADANWGLDFDDRRSTTGYCVYFRDTSISWCSKKQQVVSQSTAEAEYRSLAAATSDVTWLTSLLTEL
ncbi:uncharacterized mitochondrial protein AtMg00810-like [Gossypium hirsutum]|uniref:Uncharacterized mitochondrial protein AtMg00810-like n=1 Tax=Gossypium hirsutum TaxID=3635 RepID=A0A1U8NMK4_GOSHI|nr:uncharacterized mitochondrial protein AtMg00810-like [Gossypium hirsutum]